MVGQKVCRYHGGSAQRALFNAEKRLNALVGKAIMRIGDLIDNAENDTVRLNASRDILDRAGYRATTKVEAESVIKIEVVRDDGPLVIDVPNPHALRNGHTPAD
jgi:hypothetical protein